MNKSNVDKLAIGVLLGVCLMLAIGARGSSMSHPVGTYQIVSGLGSQARELYVLNTRTGRVWEFDSATGWDTLGHISGIEEITPASKAVFRNNRVRFEHQK
jgi:hypothetical protein